MALDILPLEHLQNSIPDLNQYTKFLKLELPPPPSQIISPSQVARRYRSQTYDIEYRAGLWKKHDSLEYARAFLAGDQTLNPVVAALTEDFWERFSKLPGEVRNQIYDEILPPAPIGLKRNGCCNAHPKGYPTSNKIVTRCVGSYIGKSFHADALYAGNHQLPRGLLYRMKPGSDLFKEFLDRWCCAVRFQLVESFELDIKKPWLGLRGAVPICSSVHLERYFDPETQHIFPELKEALWFLRMRECYLQLNLFRLRSLLRNGQAGIENFRSCLSDVAKQLKRATILKNLRIDVVLWPQKMPTVRERERPKFVNTDDLNYRWETSEKDYFAGNLETCFDPLKEVPGIQTIRVYGGNLIDAWWRVEEPNDFQFRLPSLLSTFSSQKHFIPAF